MLSEQQKQIMSDLIQSNFEISHDKTVIDEISKMDQSNIKSIKFEDISHFEDGYKQRIIVSFNPSVLEDKVYDVYTENLFDGFKSIEKSIEMIEKRISVEIEEQKLILINLLNQ